MRVLAIFYPSAQIVDIAQQLQPTRFRRGCFLLICHWFMKAYPRCALSHTQTLYTPFFFFFFFKVLVGGGRSASSTQDVRFIHISIRLMSFAREYHSDSRAHVIIKEIMMNILE